ncbi:hypothetical protein H3C70_03445 [Patescibacteria group bacterium]|nr:hypothetical protein [Patescibacteria group bacterium]
MSRPTAFLFLFTVVCAVSLAACQPTSTEAPASTPPAASSQPSESTNPETGSSSTDQRSPEAGEETVSVETSYVTPAGEEKVGFTLYVDANGVITDAYTNQQAKAPTSVMRQKSFAAELPTVLKGKKLSELESVDRVGGSSLTTGAFNKALTELKAQL